MVVFVMIFQSIFGAFITEAITELVVKSQIFKPLRDLVSKVPAFGKLFKCGYCFSFWAALFVVLFGMGFMEFTNYKWLNALFSVLLIQRGSNVVHNCIDKFTDKYYDLRYMNSEKEDD